jgi:hypothetical protein
VNLSEPTAVAEEYEGHVAVRLDAAEGRAVVALVTAQSPSTEATEAAGTKRGPAM